MWSSGPAGWTTSCAASGSPELRECLVRNGPDHLAHGISELRVARMSQARRAGVSGETRCEEVSGETGQTASSAASQSSELRGPPGASWDLLVTSWGFLLGLLWPPGPHLGLPEASWGSQGGIANMWPSGPAKMGGGGTRAGKINESTPDVY